MSESADHHLSNPSKTDEERRAQFRSLMDTAQMMNAAICTVKGEDDDGKLLFVAAYAEGESAAELSAALHQIKFASEDEEA